jgi:NarL family two-component system sensor histidine kinase YdfH
MASARRTLAESRAAIDDLRAIPGSLPEAVRAKVERFTRATGVPCALELNTGEPALPESTEDHILRVLSEALANITRHAQAGQVWVSLATDDAQVELLVRDNGQGFDPGAQIHSGHYGLLGMRERARLIGGALTVTSAPGEGTEIRLAAPTHKGDHTA